MGRILAIDYGKKRTGLAVTDPLQLIASPLDTVDTQQLFSYLKSYLAREDVECIVVGLAHKADGSPTDSTPLIHTFIKGLQKRHPGITIETEDEAYTSKQAMDIMLAGGIKKKERRNKSNVDKVSASLILQSYLESIK